MVYLLSTPIHTGKTTALQKFCKHYNAVGVLMPDVNGFRQLYNIAAQHLLPIQKICSTTDTDIIIGKYIFDASVFAIANTIINDFTLAKSEYIIIDEIGKLELDGSGLEPAFSNYLQTNKSFQSNLIITVRDYLLQQVIDKYNLQDATVLNIQQFNTQFGL